MLKRQTASPAIAFLIPIALLLMVFSAPVVGQTPTLTAGTPPAREESAPVTETSAKAAPRTTEVSTSSMTTPSVEASAKPASVPTGTAKETAPAKDLAPSPKPTPTVAKTCTQTVQADVVALDQPYMLNRLGAAMPQGMIFALSQDVVLIDKTKGKVAGNWMLRPDKRPRPMVLRVNQGDCLQVTFTNYLAPNLLGSPPINQLQPVTRQASVHVNGMQLVSGQRQSSAKPDGTPVFGPPNGIAADGSYVGNNDSSLVDPGKSAMYTLYAGEEGTYLLFSAGSTFGTIGNTAGQLTAGLFGAVNVEPKNGEYYRSQVTAEELQLACKRQNPGNANSPCLKTNDGHLIIDYDAVYPSSHPYACRPILKMVDVPRAPSPGMGVCGLVPGGQLQTFYTDLTAIITGPQHGRFPQDFPPVAASPDRQQPFREFTIHYHEVLDATQAFTDFYMPPQKSTTLSAKITAASTSIPVASTAGFPSQGFVAIAGGETIQYGAKTSTQLNQLVRGLNNTTPAAAAAASTVTLYQAQDISGMLAAGKDNFAINYGTGGIGAEVLANRLGVGPMAECIDCKFEEFFLSAWSIGDPAMVVDVPANAPAVPPPSGRDQPNQASALTKQFEKYEVYQESNQAGAAPVQIPPPLAGPKATMAFYADDPSNVYHSYIDDHVIFRILHAGANLTHVHHQHAHQWLHSPNDDNSTYLDSQMISPGAGFTLEIDYDGGGNRNKTVGDSIFHCHFYPHFAAGMWSLWRTHDVFENGSDLLNGRPVAGTRALPDGEISTGTPIPAIVPLPTLAMAPLPEAKAEIDNSTGQIKITGTGNPGFPFFIPGIAGHRAPAPPLDFAYETDAKGNKIYLDGGLARNVVTGGTTCTNGAPTCGPAIDTERHNLWDFTKNNPVLFVKQLSEEGEPVEKAAMAFHAKRTHLTFTPDGSQTLWNGNPANFITNGLPPQPGAPFADPAPYCPSSQDCDGGPANPGIRRYKAADVQMNVTFNKKGWHYPQQRFITLWSDVANTLNGTRAPEPFFFRANSRDIIEYWLTNLVPNYYELDDFQVRTPTDIIGQHIHLVKFDVTSSDGATNGWNYEDGTLSAEEVRDRIAAIRAGNHCQASDPPSFRCPQPISPPPNRFGPDPWAKNWAGAQTTIQRWYADPLLNIAGEDRTLRTVFTHDHFGPSTHQQAGLYAGLVIEPKDSIWLMNDSTQRLGVNDDGGPTSWQARILTTPNTADSYREFMLEFQDLALAYQLNPSGVQYAEYPGSVPGQAAPKTITPGTTPWGWVDSANVLVPSGNLTAGLIKKGLTVSAMPTTPTLITSQPGSGTMSVNYRNEPLPFRVNDPNGKPHKPNNPQTDLSSVFTSISRLDPDLNCQPSGPLRVTPCLSPSPTPVPAPSPPAFVYPGGSTGASPFDPYTPLMRAYQNDKVQVRVLVGGYLFNHNFSMYGLKWLFEPSASNSGYRDNQAMGISEHFEFVFTTPVSAAVPINPNRVPATGPYSADYVYTPGSGYNDLNQGLWGILRAFNTGGDQAKLLPDLLTLPNNAGGGVALKGGTWTCPANNTGTKTFNIAAINSVAANTPLLLNYNTRNSANVITNGGTNTPNALVYVPTNSTGTQLPTAAPTEPLILRANAGNCITVNLFNKFQTAKQNFPVFTTADNNAQGVVASISLYPSERVGMRPQLVSFDITQSSGIPIGFNPDRTVLPGGNQTYQWYAGNISYDAQGNGIGTPIEFGSTNLMPSDPMEQLPLALVGGLVIEPQNATWTSVGGSNVTVDVTDTVTHKFLFREFATIIQQNVYLADTKTNLYFNSVNFGTEPMSLRLPKSGANWKGYDNLQIGCGFSSIAPPDPLKCGLAQVMGNPQTPIFAAVAGTPVRFRMLHPDGLGGFPDDVFTIHGHLWQEEPYVSFASHSGGIVASATLGRNVFSQWMGSRDGFGPGNHFDILIDSAGGINKVYGDYLYKSFPSSEVASTPSNGTGGIWGIFRVCNPLSRLACVAPARTGTAGAVRGLAAARLSAKSRRVAAAPPAEAASDPGERFDQRKQARKQKKHQQEQQQKKQQP